MKSSLTWLIDNELPAYGQYDPDTKTIRINLKRHKRYFKDKETHDLALLDTCIHEIMHASFPKKTEKEICEMTRETMYFLRPAYKQKALKRYLACLK